MTFSIAAWDADGGACGVAVTSSSICVAARCAFVRAGAGAVASQNVTNPALGGRGLDLLAQGLDAAATLATLVEEERHPEGRQLVVVDRRGATALHCGARSLGRHATSRGAHCAAAGNLLASEDVPAAMTEAFAARAGQHLAERLIGALRAGLDAGGEQGPVRSAGVLVARDLSWPVVDLRVDWHEQPIAALGDLWQRYAPQLDDYVTRARDPEGAPAFGVPGNP